MDLRTYLAAIRKSWLLIVITTVLGTVVGALLYLATPPTYATTTDFYVSTPSEDGATPNRPASSPRRGSTPTSC